MIGLSKMWHRLPKQFLVGGRGARKQFHYSSWLRAASVFNMPAMSPTMTEGGIVSWKFEAGQSFSAGDVLLEVETDKATIDVEAQDDGVMWQVLVPEGEKGVPVGKPIAFLAEPGDDLSSLEKPKIEEKSEVSAEEQQKKEPEPTQERSSSAAKQQDSGSSPESSKVGTDTVFTSADPKQKLFPSVELLLHEQGISPEDAIAKIPASGPKGRLLKGDVLAYIGAINNDAVTTIANYIKLKLHLDLSNIKLAEPKTSESTATSPSPSETQEKPKPTNILLISTVSELNADINRDKFIYAFEKAIASATRISYSQKFSQYSTSPTPSPSSLNKIDLFDDLVSPSVTQQRFQVYDLHYNFSSTPPISTLSSLSTQSTLSDPFDEILGLAPASPTSFGSKSSPATSTTETTTPTQTTSTTTVQVDFKLKYNQNLPDSQQFVETFKDSLVAQIPSKQLIITN